MSVIGKALDAASKGLGKTGDVIADAAPDLPDAPKIPWAWIIGGGIVVVLLARTRR